MAKSDKKKVRETFRRAVLERDGYRCKICGEAGTDETLDPHHITPRVQMPSGGYVATNGITLCKKAGGCHEKAEAYLNASDYMGYPFEELAASLKDMFRPDILYKLIGSSYTQAVKDSENLE